MVFKIQNSNQSEWIDTTLKASLWKQVHLASKKTNVIQFTGVAVGVCLGLLTLVKRVSLFAEALIKGALNIIGSFFSQRCSFAVGLSQLFFHAPKHAIILPFSAISAFMALIFITIEMKKDPVNQSHLAWMNHDPVEKLRYLTEVHRANAAREAETQRQQRIAQDNRRIQEERNFNFHLEQLKSSPTPQSMTVVADAYLLGIGVKKDIHQAVFYYDQLLTTYRGIQAGRVLIEIYQYGKEGNPPIYQDLARAAEYAEKTLAIDKNNSRAMHVLGEKYLLEAHFDPEQAANWFNQAIRNGNDFSKGSLSALFFFYSELDSNHQEIRLRHEFIPIYGDEKYEEIRSGIRKKVYLEKFKEAILKQIELVNSTLDMTKNKAPEIRERCQKSFLTIAESSLGFQNRAYPTEPKRALAFLRQSRPDVDFTLIARLPIFQV